MVTWLVAGILLFAVLALVQVSNPPERSGAADLVFPRPGVALSLEQIEERSHNLGGGASAVEVIKSKIYRDSSGRLRVDSDNRYSPGEPPTSHGAIIEPSTGLRVLLLKDAKVAYRRWGPKIGESGFALGLAGIGEGLSPSHNWSTRSESLSRRTINGIECEGTRIVQTAEDDPNLSNTIERWYSTELNLIGFASAYGPYGSHVARIENLRYEEPDPKVFAIPTDYRIVDLESPPAEP